MSAALWITAAALGVLWICAEIWRGRAGKPGTVIRAISSGNPAADLLGCKLLVRLDADNAGEPGREVLAEAADCESCGGNCGPGSAVRVLQVRGAWRVVPGWGRGRR